MVWLAVCSIAFYGYWRVDYLPILLGSVLVNHGIAALIHVQARRSGPRSWPTYTSLLLGLTFNLGLLGYFKYLDFAISNLNMALGTRVAELGLVLPLAISFFTFQQIAYLVDLYRGQAPRHSLRNYIVFVTFFPQLIAGPIVHHKEMMPQFFHRFAGVLRWKNMLVGAIIFSAGLFKKIIIADTFAVYADAGFADHASMTTADAWIATLSYTFQIYFDFSGYSDMAIGAARLFGIRLPLNFLSPYKSGSLQAFWRRWHMTLSRFLRDYLYIPLGGNRRSEPRILLNLVVTFLLGGIWHGAGWTFVVWGAIHGLGLAVERSFLRLGLRLPALAGCLLTFATVHFAWVFFRAEDLSQATDVLRTMLGVGQDSANTARHVVIQDERGASQALVLAALVAFFLPNTYQFTRNIRPWWKTVLAAVLFGVACLVMISSSSEVFLYFNF